MKLSSDGIRWFVRLRWAACVAVFAVTWLTSTMLGIVAHPMPLYLVGCALGRKNEEQMGSVAVEVSDTGVGIPRTQLEKIFEPFFTTRGDSDGTGLGLGLCRMLISEMGGRINVRSALGQGATFTVVLYPAERKT